jgi:hypothetical protein
LESSLGRAAAVKYFRRQSLWDHERAERSRDGLRKALGPYYESKYEILVDFIEESELSDVRHLAEGRNGKVRSAVWKHGLDTEIGRLDTEAVVLKNIPGFDAETRDQAFKRFLHEV